MSVCDNWGWICYIYGMTITKPNEFEFVHDALDWFAVNACEDRIVIKIVHNPGAFAVICSDRHGVNVLYTDKKLIPTVDYYREFVDGSMDSENIYEYLAAKFRDEEGD